ncbi:MAG: hypothetical protein O7C67_12495 [Gammaproteobacteria bacterium]|nr:hypothetical protein [Gammaproteobacteria bacterium]
MAVGSSLWLLVELLTVWGQCGCLCIDGTPRTLCTSVTEAQAEPNACGLRSAVLCPVDAEDDAPTIRYASPVEGALNCREVRIWDDAQNGYTAVKVCDVDAGDVF